MLVCRQVLAITLVLLCVLEKARFKFAVQGGRGSVFTEFRASWLSPLPLDCPPASEDESESSRFRGGWYDDSDLVVLSSLLGASCGWTTGWKLPESATKELSGYTHAHDTERKSDRLRGFLEVRKIYYVSLQI